MEVVVVSVWTEVCEALTTRILLSTMIPSCIWIQREDIAICSFQRKHAHNIYATLQIIQS